MCSFAIYRLPYAHEATLVQQTEGEPAEYFSYKELNGRSGFVVAPFEVTPQQPILLIQGANSLFLAFTIGFSIFVFFLFGLQSIQPHLLQIILDYFFMVHCNLLKILLPLGNRSPPP